jgi:hypothetical protein
MALIQPRCIEILAYIVLNGMAAIDGLEIDVVKRPSGTGCFGAALNVNKFVCGGVSGDVDEVNIIPDEG